MINLNFYQALKISISNFMYRNCVFYRLYYDNKSDNYIFRKYYEKETIIKGNKQLSKEKNNVIILFNGKIPLNANNFHGGLTDRLKGIISVYDICKSMGGVDFKIYHDTPYYLNKYLEPNLYNWYIEDSQISYNINFVQPNILRYTKIKNEINYHKKRLRLLLAKKTTHHIYTNINMTDNVKFKHLFDELFKPSKLLNENIAYNQRKIGKPYISLSFRFTHLLGDPIDIYMPELQREEKVSLIKNCISCIKKLHNLYPRYKLLINSDSASFLNYVKKAQLDYTYIIPGKPVHIDQNINASEDSYMKTFTDFLMISKANKVLLIKSPNMYNSEFPRFAALIGEKPFEIINI